MKIFMELRPPRFVATLLALTSFGSYNRRVSGSLRCARSTQICSTEAPQTSDTRQTLGVIFKGSLFSNLGLTRRVKELLNKLNLSDYHG